MARTATRSTLVIVRPIKVIALICGCISLILLIIAIASTAWLEAEGYRQGLWEECFDVGKDYECQKNKDTAWITACAALTIIALIVAFIATVLTAVGLFTKGMHWKFRFYRIAMFLMFLAVLVMVVALIVFPVMFIQKLDDRTKGQTKWYFDWSYGIAWGATVFMLGAAILLLLDKEKEEIYYREKTYYNSSDA